MQGVRSRRLAVQLQICLLHKKNRSNLALERGCGEYKELLLREECELSLESPALPDMLNIDR